MIFLQLLRDISVHMSLANKRSTYVYHVLLLISLFVHPHFSASLSCSSPTVSFPAKMFGVSCEPHCLGRKSGSHSLTCRSCFSNILSDTIYYHDFHMLSSRLFTLLKSYSHCRLWSNISLLPGAHNLNFFASDTTYILIFISDKMLKVGGMLSRES